MRSKKIAVFFLSVFIITIFISCRIKSQGNSLISIKNLKKKALGLKFALTLKYINLERDRNGNYIRAFDKTNNTIFIYFQKQYINQIANLTRNKNYIWLFRVIKNDKYSTLSGKLITVANINGIKVDKDLKNPQINLRLIKMKGNELLNKVYTFLLKYRGRGENQKGEKYVYFNSDFGITINLIYSESNQEIVKELSYNKKCSVRFKPIRNGNYLWGELINISN